MEIEALEFLIKVLRRMRDKYHPTNTEMQIPADPHHILREATMILHWELAALKKEEADQNWIQKQVPHGD